MFQIHPQFQLNQQTFQNKEHLLRFLKEDFPMNYAFLEELFDENPFIKSQTSGSTGTPKTIKISKNALVKSAESTGNYFNLPEKTSALHCLSSQFIAGKMMWVRALHLGWHLTLVSPDSLPLKNADTHFDFAAMVPLQAQNSVNEIYRIKKLIIGGAPLSYEWEQKLAEIPSEIFLTYGMTETITHIAVRKIGGNQEFECLPNIKISQDKRDCLEIIVPYLSDEKIVTNDIVKITSPKTFSWLGRIDHVINSGGIKLIPEQIEKKLQPYLNRSFFISSIPDERLGEKLILVLEGDVIIENLDLIFSNAKLTKYEIPKQVFRFNFFERTENGKINRINTLKKLNQQTL